MLLDQAMQCPVYGKEMENDRIYTESGIVLLFLPAGVKAGLFFNTRKSVEKRAALPRTGPIATDSRSPDRCLSNLSEDRHRLLKGGGHMDL